MLNLSILMSTAFSMFVKVAPVFKACATVKLASRALCPDPPLVDILAISAAIVFFFRVLPTITSIIITITFGRFCFRFLRFFVLRFFNVLNIFIICTIFFFQKFFSHQSGFLLLGLALGGLGSRSLSLLIIRGLCCSSSLFRLAGFALLRLRRRCRHRSFVGVVASDHQVCHLLLHLFVIIPPVIILFLASLLSLLWRHSPSLKKCYQA